VSAPTCTWRTKRELYRKVSLPIYNHADTRIRRVPCVSRGVGPRVSGAYKVSHVLSIAVLTFGFRSARTQRQVDSQDHKGKIGKGKYNSKTFVSAILFPQSGVRKGKGRTRHDRYTTAAHRICKSQGPGSSPDHGAGVRVAWCHRPRELKRELCNVCAAPERERTSVAPSGRPHGLAVTDLIVSLCYTCLGQMPQATPPQALCPAYARRRPSVAMRTTRFRSAWSPEEKS
jgi:hypothetical protein